MESIQKMSLSAIEDRLSIYEMQEIQAGSGWWSSWGKCTAGILGGTGTGGLGGAAAASVIPGLGTVAGAIIGGVCGGLAGAAAAC